MRAHSSQYVAGRWCCEWSVFFLSCSFIQNCAICLDQRKCSVLSLSVWFWVFFIDKDLVDFFFVSKLWIRRFQWEVIRQKSHKVYLRLQLLKGIWNPIPSHLHRFISLHLDLGIDPRANKCYTYTDLVRLEPIMPCSNFVFIRPLLLRLTMNTNFTTLLLPGPMNAHAANGHHNNIV